MLVAQRQFDILSSSIKIDQLKSCETHLPRVSLGNCGMLLPAGTATEALHESGKHTFGDAHHRHARRIYDGKQNASIKW